MIQGGPCCPPVLNTVGCICQSLTLGLGGCDGCFCMSTWPGIPRQLVKHEFLGVSVEVFQDEISI